MRIAQPGKKFWAFENVAGQITPPPLGGLRVKVSYYMGVGVNKNLIVM